MSRRNNRHEDDYTDFSCSTSVERLARDVETRLRSWHLTGSDRHVSFGDNKTRKTNDNAAAAASYGLRRYSVPPSSTNHSSSSTPTKSRLTETKHAQSVIDSLSSLVHDSSSLGSNITDGSSRRGWTKADSAPEEHHHQSLSGIHTTSCNNLHKYNRATRPPPPVQLIRSEIIPWTASWTNHNDKITVSLTLALWDGPSDNNNNGSNNSDSDTELLQLPQSLRRLPLTHMPTDVFDNFSTLFGIGQHVTLTLTPPPQQSQQQQRQEYEEYEYDEGWMRLAQAVMDRHDAQLCPYQLLSMLSSMLQTAVNCAAANCQSRLPMFGWWGAYAPNNCGGGGIVSDGRLSLQQQQYRRSSSTITDTTTWQRLLPPWMSSSRTAMDAVLSQAAIHRRRQQTLSSFFRRRRIHTKNGQYLSPLLEAKVALDEDDDAHFVVSVLPGRRNVGSDSRLPLWGQTLLRHCPSDTTSVTLCAARHVYEWHKTNEEDVWEWQQTTNKNNNNNDCTTTTEQTYRFQCRQHAYNLLERVLGTTASEPLCGPPDDPMASVHCSVTWNGRPSDTDANVTEPLLSLPLRIRSRQAMSHQDWIDMEDSVERTLLDPLMPTALFDVCVYWDKETSVTSLAATQRCILAALIRATTLPPETLLQHLTNEAIAEDWSDVGEEEADHVARQAKVGGLTTHLVQAMDWTSIGDHMIEPWEAEEIVKKVMDGTLTLGFPTPPEEVFSTKNSNGSDEDDVFGPFAKSAPVGRLLSLLFTYMSKLRDPASMSLVWITFVQELRCLWESRESLPNMTYIPGLDPSPEAMKGKHCVSTIGLKADYAYFVNSSEPDPDDMSCLIGQKLQVFNIGIECSVAHAMQKAEHFEKTQQDELTSVLSLESPRRGENGTYACSASVASTEIMNNATSGMKTFPENDGGSISLSETQSEDTELQLEPARKKADTRCTPPVGTFGTIDEVESRASGTSKEEFFDTVEDGRSSTGESVEDLSMRGTEHTTNVTRRQNRKGARCPVHSISLIASGDQLYAPYFQRPFPLTDDVVLERRMMLTRGRSRKKGATKSRKIQERIEISQRLQKPKLLSDMRAFQAANPGAVFQDFINWYGNPGSPLDDYSEQLHYDSQQPGVAARGSAARKLDLASQAMKILSATREFWTLTWEEATPCAAVDQPPLFDVSGTVEMVLDSFETMHPASLLNQIVAVNMSTSYHILATAAGDAIHVGAVKTALNRLRDKSHVALDFLSRDVTMGTVSSLEDIAEQGEERLPKHASVEAIRACDAVCDAMSAAETVVCRARTLLHKFPKQYDVVHRILRRPDGEPSALRAVEGRSGILAAIRAQQQSNVDNFPTPSLREYVLRNTDSQEPCQLCVRFGDQGAVAGAKVEGGVLLALTKCHRN